MRLTPSILMTVMAFTVVACGDSVATTTPRPPATTSTTSEPTTTHTQESTTTTLPETTTTTATLQPQGDLLVVGGWGSGTLPQGAVAGAMARHTETNEVAAILTTGGNFYSDDAEFLMVPFEWAEEDGIPFWITWGDVDVETTARIELINETFDDPPRWAVYGWGGVDIVVLDSTQVDSEEQEAFLVDALASSDRPKIVAFHHPVHSCFPDVRAATIRDRWVSQFDEDVFLVLSGYERNYQRFADGGIAHVVSGGGGASLHPLQDCADDQPVRAAGEALHHFVVLEQRDGSVEMNVLNVNSEVIDEAVFDLP